MITMPTIAIAKYLDSIGIGKFTDNIVATDWVTLLKVDNPALQRTIVLHLSSWKEPETAINYDYPSIIFILRGTPQDYIECYNMCNNIKKALQSEKPKSLYGDKYTYFYFSRDITELPETENKNMKFTMQLDLVAHGGDVGNRSCPL